MDNYGEPILDTDNHLIGYKLNDKECALVETYTNKENLICNKISVKELNKNNLSFKNEYGELTSWIDNKTETGFTRDFNKKKYYYDKNNNLINVEVKFNCVKFPTFKKDTKLNEKVGTIDFETHGLNLGLGYHWVYAGGWAVKNKTELFYIKNNETNEQLVNRIINNIFMDPKLNGYTFTLII